MKICNICHKISATNQDHLDCVQKRSLLLENDNFKNSIPEVQEIVHEREGIYIDKNGPDGGAAEALYTIVGSS